MPKLVGNKHAGLNRREMEGGLKLFSGLMRQKINRMAREGYNFKMEDQSPEALLKARKDLLAMAKTLEKKENHELEIAVLALAVYIRRSKMDEEDAQSAEWG